MKIDQVAAQLYTIRDYLKTPKDIAASLGKVRAMGYQAVQISGMGPIPEAELVRILDGEGLTCRATHENGQTILDQPEAVADRLDRLNCRYTAYPHPGGVKLDTLQDVQELAAALDRAGKVLHERGKVLAYHNHAIEFRRFDGRLMLEVIYGETDPRYLQGEIDTFWVQSGGGDPAEWCRRLSGRLPLLHMKDFVRTREDKPAFAEIGRGNLNWRTIIRAAEEAGCEWFIIEQDGEWLDGDPFKSLAESFRYVRDFLAE